MGVCACVLSLVENDQTKYYFRVKEKYNQRGELRYAPNTPDKRLKNDPGKSKRFDPVAWGFSLRCVPVSTEVFSILYFFLFCKD